MRFPPFDDDLYPETPAGERVRLFEMLREDVVCLSICGALGTIVAVVAIADFFHRHEKLRFAVTAPPTVAMILAASAIDALANIRLRF